MTLRTQHTTNALATLTDEQRRRVADALESAQSENTRKTYASQLRQFQSWCQQENYSSLPAQPEVLAAYAAELADDGLRTAQVWCTSSVPKQTKRVRAPMW